VQLNLKRNNNMKKLAKKQTGGNTPKKSTSEQKPSKMTPVKNVPYNMYPDSTGSKQPKGGPYKTGAILKNAPKVGDRYKKGGATKAKKK